MIQRLLILVSAVTCIGIASMMAGAQMNSLVCNANGGKMPILIRPEYPNAAHLLHGNLDGYCEATPETRYTWLCDRFYKTAGPYVRAAYSIGDVFLWTGDWIVKILTPILALLILIAARRHARQKERNWKSIVEA